MPLIVGGGAVLTGGALQAYGAHKQASSADKNSKRMVRLAEKQMENANNAANSANVELSQGAQAAGNSLTAGAHEQLGTIDNRFNDASNRLQTGYSQSNQDLAGSFNNAMQQVGTYGDHAISSLNQGGNRLSYMYDQATAGGFEGDPGYQFRLKQGEDAINHRAAAAGGRMGGDTLKALTEYNQNFASNEYGNWANRTAGLAQGADANQNMMQSRLADTYRGIGSDASQLSYNQGSRQAGLDTGYGNTLFNAYNTLGGQEAGVQGGLYGGLANLATGLAQGQSNNIMGAATGQANMTGQAMNAMALPTQYAGGTATAVGNTVGQLGQLGMAYGMSQPSTAQPVPNDYYWRNGGG